MNEVGLVVNLYCKDLELSLELAVDTHFKLGCLSRLISDLGVPKMMGL